MELVQDLKELRTKASHIIAHGWNLRRYNLHIIYIAEDRRHPVQGIDYRCPKGSIYQ